MKKSVFVLALFLLTTLGTGMRQEVISARFVTPSGPTPIFNMPLNEGGAATTAIDYANGNNGTWSGTMSCSGSYYQNLPPNVGCFDGSTNYITTGVSSAIKPTTAVTVIEWVYQSALTNFSKCFSFPYYSGGTWAAPFTSLQISCSCSGTGYVYGEITVGGVPQPTNDCISGHRSSTTLPSNTWVCLALTYDGSNVKLYQANSLVMTYAASGSIDYGTYTGGINISRDSPSSTLEFFHGYISGIQMYNTALTAGQITTACGSAP
jgi:hypothetical protein